MAIVNWVQLSQLEESSGDNKLLGSIKPTRLKQMGLTLLANRASVVWGSVAGDSNPVGSIKL